MRWFHNAGNGVMVSTQSLRDELAERGFTNIFAWSRGVDTDCFARAMNACSGATEPVFMYVGRVAPEKNIGAFLDLDCRARRWLSARAAPRQAARALSRRGLHRAEIRRGTGSAFASADVFVFPSLTDTYGVVLLEALACGTPVAAYPVTGPKDVIVSGRVGVLDEDLGRAARAALNIDRGACRDLRLNSRGKPARCSFWTTSASPKPCRCACA